jgi:hypothetical protein
MRAFGTATHHRWRWTARATRGSPTTPATRHTANTRIQLIRPSHQRTNSTKSGTQCAQFSRRSHRSNWPNVVVAAPVRDTATTVLVSCQIRLITYVFCCGAAKPRAATEKRFAGRLRRPRDPHHVSAFNRVSYQRLELGKRVQLALHFRLEISEPFGAWGCQEQAYPCQ